MLELIIFMVYGFCKVVQKYLNVMIDIQNTKLTPDKVLNFD